MIDTHYQTIKVVILKVNLAIRCGKTTTGNIGNTFLSLKVSVNYFRYIEITSKATKVLTNVAVLGLYFTFRTIFYYLYGRVENKVIINISKSDFETLKPIQKICVSLFLFLFFDYNVWTGTDDNLIALLRNHTFVLGVCNR